MLSEIYEPISEKYKKKEGLKMNRIAAIILTAVICISLAACAGKTEDVSVKVAGLKGPTSMGMVKLMDDAAAGKSEGKYEFSLAGSADEVTPALIQGKIDIAAVPANLASVLYNNSEGKVKLLAVNTLGVIYLVEAGGETVNSVEDLRGKTIIGSGKGSTPEYSLRHILSKNGLDPDKDVNIEWKSEHTEVVQTLAGSGEGIGLLPQPFVTVAQTQIEGLRIALDLTEEWSKVGEGSQMITGVMAVNAGFAEKHPQAVKTFLKEYAASVDWVNANVEDAAALTEKFDIIKAPIAKKALPYCNIVCISGDEMKAPVSGYLQVLYDEEPKAVGGKLPGDDFYIDLK